MAKPRGPGLPMLRSSLSVTSPRATVTNKARTPGERGVSHKPSRRECRLFSAHLYDLRAFLVTHCTQGLAGAAEHPAFPAPSDFSRAASFKTRADRAAGTRACVFAPLSCPALCGASSTPRPLDSSRAVSGILIARSRLRQGFGVATISRARRSFSEGGKSGDDTENGSGSVALRPTSSSRRRARSS